MTTSTACRKMTSKVQPKMKSINAKVDEDADDGLKNSNLAQKSRHPRSPAPSRRSKVASIFFHMFGISNNDAVASERAVTPETHHLSTTRAENNGCGRTMSPALRYPNKSISEAAAPEKKSTSKFLSVLWKQVAAARKARLLRRVSAKGRADDDKAKKECRGDEMELCKQRILMGVKCRPINKSGKLHYGEDGIILPEDD